MMTIVPLRVHNIDLNDHNVLVATDDPYLEDLSWSSVDGITLATLHAEPQCDAVGAAVEAARRIQHLLPQATVSAVHEELVSSSDVAQRVGVSRETVRLWAQGVRSQNFPDARGSVGGGTRGATRIWSWSDVVAWLRVERKIDMDEWYLDHDQVAQVNACLAHIATDLDSEWRRVPRHDSDRATQVADTPVTLIVSTAVVGKWGFVSGSETWRFNRSGSNTPLAGCTAL